jgi:hypothetical protein
MKSHALALILGVATLASGSACAQEYFSLGAGAGHTSLACADIPCSRDNLAWKAVGGYRLGYGLAAELGYINFGQFTESPAFLSVTGRMETSAVTLGGAFELPLGRDWAASARLGVAFVDATVSGTVQAIGGQPGSTTRTTAFYGIGLDYRFAADMRVGLALDLTHAEYNGVVMPMRALTVMAGAGF